MFEKFKNTNFKKYYEGLLPYVQKEKNQNYIAIILTFSASIIFLLFAVNPTLSTITKLRKEVEDSKFVKESFDKKIQNLSSLSEEYNNLETDIPIILDAVPEKPEAPTLIAQIQAIAENNSIQLTTLSVSPVELSQSIASSSPEFKFEVSGSSNYENIDFFLKQLTNMQRVVKIDSININKTSSTDETLNLTLKGTAFFKNL